jgi:hypothetical protein
LIANSTNSRDSNDNLLYLPHVQQEQPVIDNLKFNQIASEIKEVLN